MTTELETVLVAVRRIFGEVQDHQIVMHLEALHGIESARIATAGDAARVLGVSRDDLSIAAKVLAHLGWYGLPKAFGITTEVECSALATVFAKAARRIREAEAAQGNEENNAH